MKIKNVEISSFRLFDDETVPFVNSQYQDDCANLVAIHAPNGFGKTSLFDAIEFCVTNNIQRLKNVTSFKEDVKSDRAQNDFSSFIHNKDNPDKEIGIRITYEDGSHKEQKVSPKYEMKLLKGEPENSYFSEVMLSQDWFNRFLLATDAAQRFEMFTKNFKDTDGLLEYYEQLKTIHGVLRKQISEKNKKIAIEKMELMGNVDEQIVEHLGVAIQKLEETGVVIVWNRIINENQIEDLSLQGEQKIYETEEEKKDIASVLSNIEKAKSGQDGLIAISELKATLIKIEVLAKNIENINDRLQKIQVLKSLIATIEKMNAEVAKYESVNKELDYLIQKYPAYKVIVDKISEIISQCNAKIKERERLDSTIATKAKELKVAQEQCGNLTRERDGWKNKIDRLEEEYTKYQSLLVQTNQANEEEQKENLKLIQLTPKIDCLKKEREKLVQIFTTVHQRQISIEIDDYKEETKNILVLSQKIKEKTALANKLEQTIQEQQHYMGQVDALVISAREMAVSLKSGVCPLCGYNYGQVESLLAAIEGNKSISKSIEEAIKLKIEIEQQIEVLKYENDKQYNELEEKIKERITAIQAIMDDLEVEQKGIEMANASIRMKRQTAQEKIRTDYSAYDNLKEEQVLAIYEECLQQAEKQLSEVSKLKETLAEGLTKLQTEHQDLSKLIDGMGDDLLEKQKKPEYANYQYMLNERGEEHPTVESWKQQFEENKKTIAEYKEKIVSAGNKRKKMEGEDGVSLADEALLLEQEVGFTAAKTGLDSQYFKTVQFIHNNCRVQGIESNTSPETILQETENTKKLYIERIEVGENRGKLLAVFMNLLKSAVQYNDQQKIKKRIDELKKQIIRMEKREKDINDETERLKTYLDEFVQSYFQLDLINMLYNTIDPHPCYKKVRFECDFNQKRPRLHVIMESIKDGSDKIVPNLYLSTAQINILSFCIFMAKAMFAKTDDGKSLDCIFVDDPIQALDDINILSMIDLLRNIAFTLNKQIVITTHDYNFFNLLQKKMPQDKFNACYLQLKERGKFSVVGA